MALNNQLQYLVMPRREIPFAFGIDRWLIQCIYEMRPDILFAARDGV
jgi:hypothetical protein